MSAHAADYKRRLRARLARRDEDEGYAELRQAVRHSVAMEGGDLPYDHGLAVFAQAVDEALHAPPAGTLYGWPEHGHSVHVERLEEAPTFDREAAADGLLAATLGLTIRQEPS